jgi:hypothetical protein
MESPMQSRLPVEETFETFVVKYGGQLVRDLISNVHPPKNADYLFHTPSVVAELKVIEQDAVTVREMQKLNVLANSWVRRGLIPPAYGRREIALRSLPSQCQREWMHIHEVSWKRRLEDANKQIKATKIALNVPGACGILFVADDTIEPWDPNDAFTFIARVLKSRKSDGREIYSSIERIVYFSVNPRGATPDGDLNYWFSSYRYKNEEIISQFLKDFGDRWIEYHAALSDAEAIRRIQLGENTVG